MRSVCVADSMKAETFNIVACFTKKFSADALFVCLTLCISFIFSHLHPHSTSVQSSHLLLTARAQALLRGRENAHAHGVVGKYAHCLHSSANLSWGSCATTKRELQTCESKSWARVVNVVSPSLLQSTKLESCS